MKKVRCSQHNGCTMHSCPHHAEHVEDEKCEQNRCSFKSMNVKCTQTSVSYREKKDDSEL